MMRINKHILAILSLVFLFSCEKEDLKIVDHPSLKTGIVTPSHSSLYTLFDTINFNPTFRYDITGDGEDDFVLITEERVSAGGQDYGSQKFQALGDLEILTIQRIDTLITWESNGVRCKENYIRSKTYPSYASFIIDTNVYVKRNYKNSIMTFSGDFTSERVLMSKYNNLHCADYMYHIFLGNYWNQNSLYIIVRINTDDTQMIGWVRIKEYDFKVRAVESFVYYYK